VTPTDLLAALPDGGRLDDAGRPAGCAPVRLVDVTHDHRQAAPGVLYACRPGRRVDGHDYAAAAVAAGSPALLVERVLPVAVPQLLVPSVADALGPAATAVHGHPSRSLLLLGVTGTNGKTTTAYLLESILAAAGHRTGLIGTVSTRVAGEPVAGVRTTPEAPDLQRLLRRMVAAGVTGAAMEVSSHGLALGRVAGTVFAAAVFTNLSQDHLDFHRDLDDYFAAKARLFVSEHTPVGVVNVDDPWGARLADLATVEILRVSPSGTAAGAAAIARDVTADRRGAIFTAAIGGRAVRVRTRLPGHFNVANALCALAAAEATGLDLDAAAAGVTALAGVPGRLEPVEAGQPFGVFVDYAHTPDSLANVLAAARRLADDDRHTGVAGGHRRPMTGGPAGRVLVVIGCGGDRDAGKRPLMGATAAALADVAVLTSDNPRGEDPRAILAAMADGARTVAGARWTVEEDRRTAIAAALGEAAAGDIVVIAGKGHETSQEFADRVVPFDDRTVAAEALAARDGAGARP